MRQSPNPSKTLSIQQVEQMIRDTETPEHSISQQIVEKLESKSVPPPKPVFTRRVGVIAAALVVFCVFLTPVMAQTIERLSLLEYINPFVKEMKINPNEKVDTLYARDLDGNKHFHTGMIRFDDIEDQEFKSQLQRAWNEIFPQGEGINEVIVYEYRANTFHIEARNDNRSIEFDQGNWFYAQQTIGENQVPDAAKDAADQAFHKVGDFKQSKRSVSQMILRPNQNPVYKFVYNTNKGSVLIDVQKNTNQITRIVAFPLSDQLNKLNDKNKYHDLVEKTKAIELDKIREETVKQAKVWMNLDLADYNVSKLEYRFDTLTFTKAGSPDVTVLFTSKGTIYSIKIELKQLSEIGTD
ncbi:MAG: hypothetical protein E7L01_25065 [Paenibacillus macerans]|uniref:Uncharacterized protein n=1 Tax=Paenibacillus macerans TaxID=44252 RepID=A0A090ZI77_PAEMA|nr:hypothetical protein [Paenibacillus macerans]KFN10073.1 hypothetical protein DJ90_636 [Paenibacillus macerans]MBS5909706.1 hypothetical protein [Paenibacillus macerans]MCY7557443.1 hypothetical protein [Paenibacillus macerans]MDU7476585.1 hypothetical protein [Paenibacillus macerans]MEC0137036.1 hypothetical protein [Paenibacillus macerans]